MAEPIRILEVVNAMDRAGLETMIMNYYREFDRDRIQLDFLTHRDWRGDYDDEIESLGGRIYRAPRLYPQHWFSYRRFMRRFFAEHDYPVVHSHIDAMSAFPLAMARACGVPVRIAHSHNESVDHDLKFPIKELARRRLPIVANRYWACSEASGAYLFGEARRAEIRVVRNAIDLESYRFDPTARKEVRAELGIAAGQTAIGHVGRFSKVKNHALLVRLLGELRSRDEDAVLVLVGDGELRREVEGMAESEGIAPYVRFLGVRGDVERVVNAFDVVVFPSIHEGIPLALIEAQANGLPVLASDAVSGESLLLPTAESLALSAFIEDWADATSRLSRTGRCEGPIDILADAGYEIHRAARGLADEYASLYGAARKDGGRSCA
ncbi:glycosyltransferase family 1 protein [Enorma shizhengliae]|uniref:Glycosyltransferase n=1 Tax=Enorma shizhengliae TaxID=2606615 RepID=A0A7K0G849_9ACTN|nr:glycosyltransferase family 1 protein [Enorma shizhengliae]MRX79399.1 glycosyltransferase [Enorma shizhengliae]